jgi:hypothetical protein
VQSLGDFVVVDELILFGPNADHEQGETRACKRISGGER